MEVLVCAVTAVYQAFQGRADLHFMDKTAPRKESPEEVIRESLISIAYSLPEKVRAPEGSSENLKSENLVEEVDCDGAEKYRSELISISNLQSPDIKGLPVVVGDLNS